MRLVLITIGVTALIAHHNGLFDAPSDEPAGSIEDVVSLRCGAMNYDSRKECVERYHAVFDSSDLDPVVVLREHCTRWENPWEDHVDEPPSTCVEKFGGWIQS